MIMSKKEYKYILNVTFYAGSKAHEDTDRELYLFTTDRPYSQNDIEDVFKKANAFCNSDEAPDGFPTYDNGLNIDTLIDGVRKLTDGVLTPVVVSNKTVTINGIHTIVQWL